ncbi:acyl-CoA dehydrogenase family protein [Pikeienuella sp. HZG-20]|uniref:acyl-CoA dehydrogenase family protein n=1 Tax=Paludibacillus litoralis TaxID=3133267 RepID=UPI0030EF2E7F
MDFTLSEERRMLADTLTRFVREKYDLPTRHGAAAMEGGFDPEMWTRFAELGAVGALLPEEAGGFGGGGEDIMVVFEALGGGLVVEPFLATAILGATPLIGAGKDDMLEAVIGGALHLALAHTEPGSRYEMSRVACQAKGGKITGRKSVVLNGGTADRLIVSARASGDEADEAGIGLWLVDPKGPGAAMRAFATVDGGHAAEFTFDGAPGEPLGDPEGGYAALERTLGRGVLALSAEALGAMEVCKTLTLDYLKTRKQFGVPLGKFQALQHRMVEMVIAIEQARSLTMLAAGMLEAPRPERERALSAAKNIVGRVGRLVSEETIQLHGGIAMTWEYAAPHFAKRLTMIDHQLGDEDFHLARFMTLAA